MLGHVVHEQDFAAFGLHREAVVGPDPSLRRHERGIGQDHVGVLIPPFVACKCVVLEYLRSDEAVQVHVYQGQPHHVRRYVVALEVVGKPSSLIGCQRAAAVSGGIGGEDVLVRGNQEPSSAAGGVEHDVILFGVHDSDDEIDDVTRRAELARIALGAENGEEVLKRVAQPLRVVVRELVDNFEEGAQGFRVAVGQIGVVEYVPEERWYAGGSRASW